jgi:hypothetical protein
VTTNYNTMSAISILDYCIDLWGNYYFSVNTSRTSVSNVLQETRNVAAKIAGTDILQFSRDECRNTYSTSLVLRRWRNKLSTVGANDHKQLIDSLAKLQRFMERYKRLAPIAKSEIFCLVVLGALAVCCYFFVQK